MLSGGRSLSYEYDAEERITKVTDSVDGVTEYTYDALGQLMTETVNGIVVNTMTYDNYGNIVSKNGKTYTYGDNVWKDLLTSYDGQPITYDAQGNPVSYLGHTLTWEKGRQLKSFDGNTYTYNANGIRTGKTVNSVKHTYTLDGTKILREVRGENVLIPLYDNEDSVCGIIYNNEPFYFQKNLQGDIIGIANKNAEIVARYSYDAWGVPEIKSDTSECQIATVNPYRYRGYYYDEEIELYYLQSRYYDAGVGRFINADDPDVVFVEQGKVTQYNYFAYCLNSPADNKDFVGKWVQVVVGALIGAILAAATYWLEYKLGMRNWNSWVFAGIIALGAALGALGSYAKYWVKMSNLALKFVQKVNWAARLAPVIQNLILWAITGLKFLINGIAKSFSRKPGESWDKTIKRIFGWS